MSNKHHGGGFNRDMSSEAQARRGRANRGKTPWRSEPSCGTTAAKTRFETHRTTTPHRREG